METTRLSSKGQVILPKSVRDANHWGVGTEFEVVTTPEGVLLRPAKPFPVTRLQDVIGCVGYQGPTKSIKEMEEAIQKGIRDRRARGRY